MNTRPARVSLRDPSQLGFTLIELMVVVVIIAILASVALPAYDSYVMRSRIPDATGALATKRMQMEQFFQDNHTYAGADTGGGPCIQDNGSSKYFNFFCSPTASATPVSLVATPAGTPLLTYIITAQGKGPMAGFTYTIDYNNAKNTTIASPAPSKWTGGACWITKAGGC